MVAASLLLHNSHEDNRGDARRLAWHAHSQELGARLADGPPYLIASEILHHLNVVSASRITRFDCSQEWFDRDVDRNVVKLFTWR
jgi:hypothetical protein